MLKYVQFRTSILIYYIQYLPILVVTKHNEKSMERIAIQNWNVIKNFDPNLLISMDELKQESLFVVENKSDFYICR